MATSPPPLGEKPPVAYFLGNMFNRIGLRIQGLDKVQSPLLALPVVHGGRLAMVGCLCCGGLVGGQAQYFVFEVSSAFAHSQRKRMGMPP